MDYLEYLTDIQQSDMALWPLGIGQRVSKDNAHRFIGLAICQDQFEFHSFPQPISGSIGRSSRMFVRIAMLNLGQCEFTANAATS